MSYAMQSSQSIMIDAAHYFESKGDHEKAVQLYEKGGELSYAMSLCFKAGNEGRKDMFDILQKITDGLTTSNNSSNASPQVILKCAEFFIEHNQADKAIHLYTTAKRYKQAIDLCAQHKVKITEELADALTPDKDDSTRVDILKDLATVIKRQGSYHLACKKYTQAGDRLKAMQCLLKTGDTKNIIYYASVGRSRDMYILAANYLQNLDWHNDSEVMKAIISFYTKAKAYDQLAGFYDACAQVEIDEYRDYSKALGALNEAAKCLEKASKTTSKQQTGGSIANVNDAAAALQQRMHLVEQFVTASSSTTSSLERIAICKRLLEHQSLDVAVRVGDCYNTIIETYAADQNWNAAYEMISAMQQRGVKASQYVTADLIAHVCKSIGLSSTEFLAPAAVTSTAAATRSTAGAVHADGNTDVNQHDDDDEIEEDNNIVNNSDNDDVVDDGPNSDDEDRYAHK
eukprot:6144-Heterococcus_DN1.PRE.1